MVTQHGGDATTAAHGLHWARAYALFGNVLTLGRAAAMREQNRARGVVPD